MRRIIFLIFAFTFIVVGHIFAHVTEHSPAETGNYQFVAHHEAPDMKLTSGQGVLKFKVLYTRDHFPPEVVSAIDKAHGGFDVDRREGKGETYFALPEVGIIQISADLKTTRLIETPPALKKANAHYVTVWTTSAGIPYLSFPANDVGKIFTTTMDGKLIHTLEAPDAMTDFEHQAVNTYFSEGGKFVPTGITHINGMLYVTTGYSDLDYILGRNSRALIHLRRVGIRWHSGAKVMNRDNSAQDITLQCLTVQIDWMLPIGRMQKLNAIPQMAPTWKHSHLSKDHSRVALTTKQDTLSSHAFSVRIRRKARRSTSWRATTWSQPLC